MRRREFIAGLGAAITGSIRTNAEALPPVRLVGYLYHGPVEGAVGRQVGFRQGLAETDYFEGDNVAIESRWTRNQFNRLPELATDLVHSGIAVLVATYNMPAVLDDAERQQIIRALREADGNRSKAARHLGIERKSLYKKARRLGIDLDAISK